MRRLLAYVLIKFRRV